MSSLLHHTPGTPHIKASRHKQPCHSSRKHLQGQRDEGKKERKRERRMKCYTMPCLTSSQLCESLTTSAKEKVILQIEKQAVIQAMLKEVACQLASSGMAPSTDVSIRIDSGS